MYFLILFYERDSVMFKFSLVTIVLVGFKVQFMMRPLTNFKCS